MKNLHTGLNTNKGYKFINLFNRNLVSLNLSTAVLLSVISSQAFANRPAMDEPHETMQDAVSEAINEPVEEMAHRPVEAVPLVFEDPAFEEPLSADQASEDQTSDNQASTEALPSSVDQIMQQQTQQTRGVLKLPAKEMQPGETIRINALDSPRRGMSMDKVKNEYGKPIAMSNSVGEPPITRWTYRDRIVYFEHSHVIHAVAR